MLENQNENRKEDMIPNITVNNASEYTITESTSSAQNASQTDTSATTQFVRIPTRIVSPRQNTHDSDTFPNRNITFNLPSSPNEMVQDGTQNITSIRDTSVNVLSPTRTIFNSTRKITRSVYDPLSVPSVFKYPNRTMQPENNHNNNQQTSSQHYDPFNYSFFSTT